MVKRSTHVDSTVIPGTVTAQVSLRIVPDQDLESISQSLVSHLQDSFRAFQSPNNLSVGVSVDRECDNVADLYVGSHRAYGRLVAW